MKILRRFFANCCHEIGCENDQTYIFRFVTYLSTFFYIYLSVNIHFQLIILTNVSILTNPAYFVPPSCHCGILALRSRDFCDYWHKILLLISRTLRVVNAGQLRPRTTRTETSRPVSENKSARKRGLVGPYVKTTRTVSLFYNIVQYLYVYNYLFI